MQAIILGTSSMVPTKDRNHTAIFVTHKNDGLLFDCGEGTQKQFKIAGIPLSKIKKLFITHWHGDHVLGIPGLMQSMAASDYSGTLRIYGPKGTTKFMKHILSTFEPRRIIDYEVKEVREGKIFENTEYTVTCAPMKHSVPCLAYSVRQKDYRRVNMTKLKRAGVPEGPLVGDLQRGKDIQHNGKSYKAKDYTTKIHGKKLTLVTDTIFNNNAIEIANESDLLICEATYKHDLHEKAIEHGHMTAQEAGRIAAQSESKKLVLIHFSARYKNPSEIEEDARVTFDNVFAAKDFMKFTV